MESASHSVEDEKALKIMSSSIKKIDGRYEIALPWKTDTIEFPYNRSVAESRLAYLKKKLIKNDNLFELYKSKIDEYLSLGHARQIPDLELAPSSRTWYIPHHATQGKFRIVFDCACKFGEVSLNHKLFSGPDLTSSLLAVLLRFREHCIAIVSDIKGMFHQVRVNPETVIV